MQQRLYFAEKGKLISTQAYIEAYLSELKMHLKKTLQKNNNSKEQGNAERLTQENNSLRNKV